MIHTLYPSFRTPEGCHSCRSTGVGQQYDASPTGLRKTSFNVFVNYKFFLKNINLSNQSPLSSFNLDKAQTTNSAPLPYSRESFLLSGLFYLYDPTITLPTQRCLCSQSPHQPLPFTPRTSTPSRFVGSLTSPNSSPSPSMVGN